MSEVIVPQVGEKWAVIQTASIMPDSTIVMFADASGNRSPVVLYSSEDEQKVRKAKRRFAANAGRVNGFDAERMLACTPVLGIVKIRVDLPIKRPDKPAVAASVPSANGVKPTDKQKHETAKK